MQGSDTIPSRNKTGRLSFGLYEVDLETQEIWRSGQKLKLQSQPFKVLSGLLDRPGEVVSREELQRLVWGDDTTVDFQHSLGIAVNKIREALGDSAEDPQYVETLSRRGYRFIAAVSPVEGGSSTSETPPVDTWATEGVPHPQQEPGTITRATALRTAYGQDRRTKLLMVAALAAMLGIGVLAGFLLNRSHAPVLRRVDQLTHNSHIFPGASNMESLGVMATDGVRIFTLILEIGRSQVASIDIHGGGIQRLTLPDEIGDARLGDLSPDGSKLLIRRHLSARSEQPVWIVPTNGGSALRVGSVLAHDAVWMPNGTDVLYANGSDLTVIRPNNGQTTRFASLPGRAFWMRWSPDGKLLRFTLLDPTSHTSSLWELPEGSNTARPVLKGWTENPAECCGTWTADGKFYIFQASHGEGTDLWQLNGTDTQHPTKLTNGPLAYGFPLASRSGHRIYFLGLATESELERFDKTTNSFIADRGFLSDANRISYTRDGQWVAWTDQSGRLWRARASDGSQKIQLTPDTLQVFLAHWSPDGQHLAMMARGRGQAWQIYLVSAEGSAPTQLLPQDSNQGDPDWSPDGRSVVFGRATDHAGEESGSHTIEVLNLKSGQVSTLPGSESIFSPRWSPDGRWIAALTIDLKRVLLFDTQTRAWRVLAEMNAADPVWTADSKALVVHNPFSNEEGIVRVGVPGGEQETIAKLFNLRQSDKADFFFVGITPENIPLVRARSATGDLYTLDLDQK